MKSKFRFLKYIPFLMALVALVVGGCAETSNVVMPQVNLPAPTHLSGPAVDKGWVPKQSTPEMVSIYRELGEAFETLDSIASRLAADNANGSLDVAVRNFAASILNETHTPALNATVKLRDKANELNGAYLALPPMQAQAMRASKNCDGTDEFSAKSVLEKSVQELKEAEAIRNGYAASNNPRLSEAETVFNLAVQSKHRQEVQYKACKDTESAVYAELTEGQKNIQRLLQESQELSKEQADKLRLLAERMSLYNKSFGK